MGKVAGCSFYIRVPNLPVMTSMNAQSGMQLSTLFKNRDHVQTFIQIQKQQEHFFEQPVFLVHREELKLRYHYLQTYLPACRIHYAVKCCTVQPVLETLHALGCDFEIASEGEFTTLQELGFAKSSLIHTHPVKRKSEIASCIAKGIKHFVIDTWDELEKFKSYTDQVEIMVRIAFPNQDAKINLSEKFGMPIQDVFSFIQHAVQEGFPITGICFHAGSQLLHNEQHLRALNVCKTLFDALKQEGIVLKRLDIGGGFPFYSGQTEEEIRSYFQPINQFLETHFKEVDCIAEPGRFLAAAAATLVCQVIGKRKKESSWEYYLNDGLYGCLSSLHYDLGPSLLEGNVQFHTNNKATICDSVFYGPTCDSFDKITKMEAPELSIDDLVIFRNMGAYSIASASNFNQISSPRIFVNN